MLTRLSAAMGMTLAIAAPAVAAVPPPAAVVADELPAVPETLVDATRPYLQSRRAAFLGWNPADRSMLIKTRFGATEQLHVVQTPYGDRRQVSFEDEPIMFAALSPDGATTVVQKDVGGGEFYQLYTLKDGRLSRITDGESRNWFGAWVRTAS
ncbi:hypothetical protein LRS10_20170 [Phenylobacterium sp. J426]|uniref:hypothetical protein n=1 Tax=Phenylobacterium sp. J426 TaxID=2898439 RepID=UPI0021509431|nr:hypothetical protein [Phenylobacterium sp. J426]MCR5876258.1 hypothetical protein [Phenylobacterium sp. J426]